MNMFKKGLLATAAAVTLGIGGMGSAYADTYATSILSVNNLQLTRGGVALTAADFTVLTGTNDAHTTATFNGFVDAHNASQPVPAPAIAGPSCAGSAAGCAAVGASFTPTGVIAADFAYANQTLAGSIIGGGATAQTRADTASISNNSIGAANSDVGTSTSFQFALGSGGTITFDFTANAYSDARVIDGGPISNANARLSWSVNIVDTTTGAVVYSFAPEELNSNSLRSATDQNPGTTPYNFTYTSTLDTDSTTGTLTAGTLYQLTIQHNTLANVLQEEVPEPATLAILAGGLLSMSLVSRRRKS
ncbi:PEP-CTERM sorting domain-containing protein [Massilia sp. METH4]|uniref:PEP-CTERM sorting domain-containing protein n=1 Tax=Massilia sp. METH4 TaxID=3123041 RepID=UPI0030CBF344